MIITECLEKAVKKQETDLADYFKDDTEFTQLEEMIKQRLNTAQTKWQVICKPVCLITLESEPDQYLSLEINDLMVLLFNWGNKKTEVEPDGWNISELEAQNSKKFLDDLSIKNRQLSTARDSMRLNYHLSASPSEFERECVKESENEDASIKSVS